MKNLTNKIFVFISSIIISIFVLPKKTLSIKYLLTLLIKIGIVSFSSKKLHPLVSKLLDNFNISSLKVVGLISGIISGISSSSSAEGAIEYVGRISGRGGVVIADKKSVLADGIAMGITGAFI